LRASNYYRASEFFMREDLQDPRSKRAYERTVDCYQNAAKLFDPPIESVEIPYERTTLPGYFHRVDALPKARPTLIAHTGFDGCAEELHFGAARAAVEHGYNVLAFDGPGQFGPVHREGLTFRPDWENVIAPVVDFVLKQPGVDPKRIVLMGNSMGGELAPRAAAYEKRIAALIANDGVFDYSLTFFSQVPPEHRAAVKQMALAGEAPELDQMLAGVTASSPTARWAFAQGMYAFGVPTPRKYVAATLAYTLADGIAEKISCPTLICDPENDETFQGQPQTLYDHLTCRKTLLRFTTAEGAGDHCQTGAKRLAFARIFDWLDETLA
jgi:pimeloyl-ACP methyl ester carboxylesterase